MSITTSPLASLQAFILTSSLTSFSVLAGALQLETQITSDLGARRWRPPLDTHGYL